MFGLLMVVEQIFPSSGVIALIAVVANSFMDLNRAHSLTHHDRSTTINQSQSTYHDWPITIDLSRLTNHNRQIIIDQSTIIDQYQTAYNNSPITIHKSKSSIYSSPITNDQLQSTKVSKNKSKPFFSAVFFPAFSSKFYGFLIFKILSLFIYI